MGTDGEHDGGDCSCGGDQSGDLLLPFDLHVGCSFGLGRVLENSPRSCARYSPPRRWCDTAGTTPMRSCKPCVTKSTMSGHTTTNASLPRARSGGCEFAVEVRGGDAAVDEEVAAGDERRRSTRPECLIGLNTTFVSMIEVANARNKKALLRALRLGGFGCALTRNFSWQQRAPAGGPARSRLRA